MENDSFYQIIVLIGLLILSAFFSGSEVAIFSLDEKSLRKSYEKEGSFIQRYLLSMIENPHRILVTILLLNTLVNVAASILGVIIAIDIAHKTNISVELILAFQIPILIVIILLFSEIIPKVLANKNPLVFARWAAFPLYWLSVLIYPISKLIVEIFDYLKKKISLSKKHNALIDLEITELASISRERGTIEQNEQELIHDIVSFQKITVKEIMTPRVDIDALSISDNFEDIIQVITESGKSRLPLYSESLDSIIGIIYAKDLLRFLKVNNPNEIINIKNISRVPYFVPANKLISDLLSEFQEKNLHMGIVVDEYGGTLGLITLEDILEEIVGEINDEFDDNEVEFKRLNNHTFLALGKISISDLNSELESDFSSSEDEYETLGGFIFYFAEKIPDVGFSIEQNGFIFTVKSVEDKRINEVQIEKILKPND